MNFLRYERIVEFYPAMWPLLVPGYVPILNAMQEIVGSLGHRPKEILDLGCGPGSATIAVAPACDPAGSITLVDGAVGMLRAAQALLGNSVKQVISGDFTTPTTAAQAFLPNCYDLALCSFALHHQQDTEKRQIIEALGNSIRKGGVLLLADEVATERPAGWQLIEQVRGRIIQGHLDSGRIPAAFLELETSLPADQHLPFLPTRVDDLTSFMARAGFAVTCPILVFGSALLVGVKSS